MAVTFQTDLRDLKDYNYVQQMPLDALFKNLGYKQAKYDQSAQQFKLAADSLWNIPAYGPDIAKKNELIAQANQELSKFAGSDLSDPTVNSQLMGYIGQVASSPDLVGIAARGNFIQQAEAKRKDLTKDGSYINPEDDVLQSPGMQKWLAGQEGYNPSKRFSGDVYKSVDWTKFNEDVLKSVPEDEYIDTTGTYDDAFKAKSYGTLKNAWMNSVNINGDKKAALLRRFGSATSGTDWNDLNFKEHSYAMSLAKQNQALAKDAMARAKSPSDLERAKQAYNKAVKDEGEVNDFMQNSDPDARKDLEFKKFVESEGHKFALTRLYTNQTGHKVDELEKANHQANLDRITHAINNAEDIGSLGLTQDENGNFQIVDPNDTTIPTGQPILDAHKASKSYKSDSGAEVALQPTLAGLDKGDPVYMKEVLLNKPSKFGLKDATLVDFEDDGKGTMTVSYFRDKDMADRYERAKQAGTAITGRLVPLKKNVTSAEMKTSLMLEQNKYGENIRKAASGKGAGVAGKGTAPVADWNAM